MDAWLADRFTLVTSEPLLEELADVLARPITVRKCRITPEQADHFLTSMRLLAEMVPTTGTQHFCRDPDDDMFIETAIAGHADVIISQDDDLLAMRIPGIQVLTAGEFLRLLNLAA
jgi:putative PIN family toxin of toxin-antitoxin system